MPVSHVSKWYAIEDAQIFPLLTDPEPGGTSVPTYSPAIDVPGVKSWTISGDVESKELRGDNKKLDSESVLTGITGTMEYAKLSLDALQAMIGGEVFDSTAPPGAAFDYSATDQFPYFMLIGRSPTADTVGGDVWMMGYKCKLSSFPEIGFAEEDYQTFSVDMDILPLTSTEQWVGIRYNEVKGSIAEPAFCPITVAGALAPLDQNVPADCVPVP